MEMTHGSTLGAFHLSIHPDHKYIWLRGGISTIKKFTSGRGWGRVTRQIKCLITQAPEVIPHPLPEVNFLMVEIPIPKPYIS
jgi:hypothetical protein